MLRQNRRPWGSASISSKMLGPVAEEILFRGLVLRSLQPYGKKFAIVISSLLFGLFHGNLMQAPFAFVVGLVMGYVAMEYHIGWAVALHLINNLVFADLLPRILAFLPQGADDLILTVFLLVCTLAAVVILILRWREIVMDQITIYDQGCNEEFQKAMKGYFEGTTDKESAINAFYKAVVEKYPDLTY